MLMFKGCVCRGRGFGRGLRGVRDLGLGFEVYARLNRNPTPLTYSIDSKGGQERTPFSNHAP